MDTIQVDTTTVEGRLLMGAVGLIIGEMRKESHPNDVLAEITALLETLPEKMQEHTRPKPFPVQLKELLNRNSIENFSNTPDHILAKYLVQCLEAYNVATQERELLKSGKPSQPSENVESMDKSIKCLALELPEQVWNDVNERWQKLKKEL